MMSCVKRREKEKEGVCGGGRSDQSVGKNMPACRFSKNESLYAFALPRQEGSVASVSHLVKSLRRVE